MAAPSGNFLIGANKVKSAFMLVHRTQNVRLIHLSRCLEKLFRRFDRETGERIKDHPEKPEKGEYVLDPPKGKIYDKMPFKVELQAGKVYHWCTCGCSHTQPFCDGTHKKNWNYMHHGGSIKFHPHRFRVEETKQYWLCNCKQTGNRPFCDGTHKRPDIQEKKLG